MSCRSKKLLALFCATALSMTAVAGCTGTKSSTGNVVSSETEVNAEETVAQSETGTFSSTDMFTERDLAGTYEESGAVYVTLSDDGITGETAGVAINGQTMTITAEGTYIFSGTLLEGQIVVDADNAKVQIVFDNVDITCASSAAVYVKSAEKVFVTLAEGSQNTLRNTDEYVAIDDNNIDAVIFAKSDLTLNGTGSLTIASAEGHGIVSKDDLKITGGTYDITAAGHALSGKDSVRIADGTFILNAEKDGIHAENADDEEKGYIYIADGDFTITSDGDGMDASNIVQIEDGTLDITAGGGAANSLKTHESDVPGGPGGGMPQNGEKPDGESMPQMGEKLDGENMTEMGKRPDGTTPPEKPSQTDQSDTADETAAPDNATDHQSSSAETTEDTTTDESGTSTKGIKAGGGMYLNGGTYQIDSADDSIHSNANITIADGTYTLATGDDGVNADDALIVNGGTITVTESYEGLEGLTVTIDDGTIDITASDDGINTAGEKMELNGGYIHILAGGDGVDSNGDLTINGGEIYIDGPSDNGNSAIDYGDRSSAYVNGGTLVAIGSSGMAEVMSDSSKQKVLMVKLGEQMEGGNVVLTDSEGNVIVSYTALKTYDCVIISTAEVESGATYTLTISGTTKEVTAE